MYLRTASLTRKVQGKRDQLLPDSPRDLSCASMGTLGRKASFMRVRYLGAVEFRSCWRVEVGANISDPEVLKALCGKKEML